MDPNSNSNKKKAKNKEKARKEEEGKDDGKKRRRRSKKTLYEVLQSSPDASKAELKRKYIALAKQTHPDATHTRASSSSSLDRAEPMEEFSEIAAAWRILSNKKERQKYDRTLRAEQFTGGVERFAAKIGKEAGPPAKRIFETVAVPLIRRTTATTIATFSAAAEELSSSSSPPSSTSLGDTTSGNNVTATGIGEAFVSAVKAGQRASKAIDRLELLEKSSELEQRAEEEAAKALQLKEQLSDIINQRLDIALQTPKTPISSLDAMKLLDSFNAVDSLTLIDRGLFRHTLTYEIEALEEVELDYSDKLESRNSAESHYQESADELDQANINLQAAIKGEKRAREALEAAKALVESSKQRVSDATKDVSQTVEIRDRAQHQFEKSSSTLSKTQEKVRKALKRKQTSIQKEEEQQKRQQQQQQQNHQHMNTSSEDKDVEIPMTYEEDVNASNDDDEEDEEDENNDDDNESSRARIVTLLMEEKRLMNESAKYEEIAGQLRSRAKTLRDRARKGSKVSKEE